MASATQSRVLLTGGCGFIGSHVALALLDRGDAVIVVDEMNDYYDIAIKEENLALLQAHGAAEHSFVFYKASVQDEVKMAEIVAKERPDVICHLAARAGVRNSIDNPLLYCDSNIRGTLVLLDEMRKHPSIRNFVYASSSSVYGDRPQALQTDSDSTGLSNEERFAFRETDVVDFPVSPYAATKRCCELLAWNYAHLHKLPCIGLRFFTVYGPRGRPDMAPFKFVSSIAHGKPIQQFGDGTSRRDYTFVSDIAAGVLAAIDHHSSLPRQASHQVFNLGKGETTSLSEFIQLVEKSVGRKADIQVLPAQPGDVPFTRANIDLAKEKLGYAPTTPPSVGIPIFVEWFRQFEASHSRS